jgi:hypothetical protein
LTFAKEIDLCAAFIKALPKGWTAYAETGGFDILLSRDADGFQIGIEAKLKLNAKVVCQAAESMSYQRADLSGPDCRAVLIPERVSLDMAPVCIHLGITVIRVCPMGGKRNGYKTNPFHPPLPPIGKENAYSERYWHERAPASRITLPDYVPDTLAGDKSPVTLTGWKIKAIKIAVTLDKRGYVTRADFKHHQISMSLWSQRHWITLDRNRKVWTAGSLPDFRAQHPTNYVQIEADYEAWKMPNASLPAVQEGMDI